MKKTNQVVFKLLVDFIIFFGLVQTAMPDDRCSDPIVLFDGYQTKATFDGSNCLFRTIPSRLSGVIKDYSYFFSNTVTCPPIEGLSVYLDGQNCTIYPKPSTGFVWKNKYFYMKYDACSRGSNDGVNCLLGTSSDGVRAFEWNGGFYTTPLMKPECPAVSGIPLQYYDGSSCYLGAKPKNGFVWKDKYFYMKYDACSHGSNDGVNCQLGTAPDGVRAFEWNGGFYTTAFRKDRGGFYCPTIPGMPSSYYDGSNCYLGAKPKNGFVWRDKYFYMQYDTCSRGSNDGVNCQLGTAPDGVRAFEWNGGFYTTPLMKPECPAVSGIPLQYYDGSSCYLGAKPQNGFVWKDKYFYMKYDACSRGSNDGVNCQLGTAPDGTTAYENKYGWFFTGLKSCKEGKLQGDLCLIGTGPKNHIPFIWNNEFYYSADRCGGDTQACCPGNTCDLSTPEGNSLYCISTSSTTTRCGKCGKPGQACCSGLRCDDNARCNGTMCIPSLCPQNQMPQYFTMCLVCGGYKSEFSLWACSKDDAKFQVQQRGINCQVIEGSCW